MFGRTSGYFLLLVLLLDPSSAFLVEKCNIDLDRLEKLLKEGEVSLRLVLQAAGVLLSIFKENPDLAQEYPSIKAFVQQLVRQGSKIVTAANLAYFGVTLYLGAVILTSYCFLVHSQKQLVEARFIDKKLNLIMVKVEPILDYIEISLKGGQENGLRNACNMKMEVKEILKDRSLEIQNIVLEIKKLEKQCIEGKEQSKVLQITSGVCAGAVIIGVAAMAAAPAGMLVAGAVGAASVLGHNQFEVSKLKYEQTLKLLEKTENKSFGVEKAIRMLETNLDIACDFGWKNLESAFKWKPLM